MVEEVVRLSVLSLFVSVLVGCASSEEAPAQTTDASTSADVTTQEASLETSGEASADTRDASCKLTKPYSSKDAVCNACAESKCCAEVNGCLAETRCDDDYVNCILACALLPEDAGDAAAEQARCLGDCATQHPAGKSLYDAAIGCVTAKCSECD